ncbi:MAG TPA: group 1 truncated hemoglobin [Sphingomicrobium sp.]|jgi:hemoglobin|nr:group 1 truncated hemoglobin [Sphingomicrobium sp.]
MANDLHEELQPTAETQGGTRRDILQTAMLLSAAAVAGTLAAPALAAGQQTAVAPSGDKPLYDRLGGIFAIAAVVDYFSDELIKDPVAGARSANPQLREWSTHDLGRLPGLKFMRTLWVAKVSGGPFQYTPTRPGSTNLGLENAHKDLKISPAEFDATAAVLSRTLDHFSVPAREKSEVLGAFAAHKNEVTKGWRDAQRKAG